MSRTRLAFALLVVAAVALVPGVVFASSASVSLSSPSGAPGATIYVGGSGFPGRVSGSITVAGVQVATFHTNWKGVISSGFVVPRVPAQGTSVAVSAGGTSASAPFSVLAGSSSTSSTTTTTAPSTTTTTAPSTTTTTTAPTTTTTITTTPTTSTVDDQTIVPMYIYPTPGNSAWAAVTAHPPAFVIADVTSLGAGTSVDSNYVSAINTLHAAGGKVLGYVETHNGGQLRSSTDVQTDLNNWKAWYHIDGVFFDEVPTDTTSVPTMQDFSSRARSTIPGTVVFNPGTFYSNAAAASYMPLADIHSVIENTDTNYNNGVIVPPSWVSNYPATAFLNLIQSCSSATAMLNDKQLASSRYHASYFYATTDTAWGTVPSYYTQELHYN